MQYRHLLPPEACPCRIPVRWTTVQGPGGHGNVEGPNTGIPRGSLMETLMAKGNNAQRKNVKKPKKDKSTKATKGKK